MRSNRPGPSSSNRGTNNACLPSVTILVLLHLAATAHAFCYFPNGQLTSNYQPCAGDIGSSATTCCDQGYACLGNGLCQATGFELPTPGAREFMRGGCTDKTWTSSGCPLFCINPKLNNLTTAAGVGSCPGSGGREYYCVDDEHNQLSCGGSGTFELPGNAYAVTIIGVDGTAYASTKVAISSNTNKQSSTTTSATKTPSPQSTTASTTAGTGNAPGAQTTSTGAPLQPTSPNTPIAIDNTNATNNTAMIAGVTAGVVGGLILGGVLVWFFLRRRKQHKEHSSQAPTAANFPITINNNINNSRDSKYSTEKQWWWWYQQQQQYNASQQHLPHAVPWQQHTQHSESHVPSAYSGQNSLSSSGSTTVFHELRGGEVRSPQELPANQGSWL